MFVRIKSISWVFSNQSSPFLAVPLTIGNFVALEIRINGSTRYCWVHICQAVRYIRYQVKADKVCSWNICEQKYFKAVSFRLHMNYEKPFYTLTHLTSLWSRALPFSQLSSPVQFCCRKTSRIQIEDAIGHLLPTTENHGSNICDTPEKGKRKEDWDKGSGSHDGQLQSRDHHKARCCGAEV